jgi:SET domain-containing protein
LLRDGAQYTNHSEKPNKKLSLDESEEYSVKDIEIGEELVDDYSSFGEFTKAYQRILKKYHP